jgi:lipoprotein-anchoring transpeptidase ErfK/SrfK
MLMPVQPILVITAAATAVIACGRSDAPADTGAARAQPAGAEVYWDNTRLSPEELERGRMDASWRRVVQIDSVAWSDSTTNPETWEDISAERINNSPMHLPLYGDVAGPSVFRTQVLLDRALFSPGVIDGRWGKNTEKALYWFQKREGLPATGNVDQQTFERLTQVAGTPTQLARQHRLTAEDVEGPFVQIPEDIYAQAELECLCYESLREKLGELFHTSPETLEQLNPGVTLNNLTAGSTLYVPHIRDANAGTTAQIASLIVSDKGSFVHAVDAQGRIVYHFPSTLGSSYDPSPAGEYQITSITEDPWWHYQPDLLAHVDNSRPDAKIPPGPNNAVGKVWMALSKPHYGIHGTSAPETIGYASSAGCVRLTNWDAIFLSRRISDGIDVKFRDT